VNIREHTDAVVAALEDLGLTVGDAVAPAGASPPYVTVYPIPGGGTSGTLGDPDADVSLIYQVTCTGVSREQVQWLEDVVRGLLDGIEVSDRKTLRVSLDMHGGTQRDDQLTPPVFWSTPRFRVFTTPSGEEEESPS